jgi:hemerythrin
VTDAAVDLAAVERLMRTSLHWTPALAVGIPEIDTQHQELFSRAERLITSLRAGERDEVLPLLAHLRDYAVQHFAAEERLMRTLGYPGLADHAAAHETFCAELLSIEKDVQRTGPTALAALTVHNWLSDWLRKHVGGLDLELGRHVAARSR